MLISCQLCSSAHPLFSSAWDIYQASFPGNEKRSPAAQEALFSHPAYCFTAWHRAGQLVGFIASWHYPDFSYLEHLAVNPALRSSGHGRGMVGEWMGTAAPQVLLEIDPVVDAASRRRLAFYRSLGFVESGIEHAQPSYSDGLTPVPLRLLFFPAVPPLALIERFWHLQQTEMTQSIRDTRSCRGRGNHRL